MIFKHSGTFGDLIYSLYAVKKMGGGTIALALHNIERCVAEYGYRPDEVDPAHKGRFTEQDFAILKPLLLRQEYINDVVVWDGTHDVDLDRFRGVLFRGFEGNYVQAMCMTHGLPFSKYDLEQTWLTADIYRKRPVVVNRGPSKRQSSWNLMGVLCACATGNALASASAAAVCMKVLFFMG